MKLERGSSARQKTAGRVSKTTQGKGAGSSAVAVRSYTASAPRRSRSVFRNLRSIIRGAAPADAIESISYGMPTLKLDGRPLIYCAAWANHVSIYPLTGHIRRELATELKRYKTSRGTIQFPLDEPLPVGFIKRIVRTRVSELRGRKK
jgi:uncharacterized protein YdhG (YjbR/CyaY superfamily)